LVTAYQIAIFRRENKLGEDKSNYCGSPAFALTNIHENKLIIIEINLDM
jgi:hypothetical protein